MGVIDRDWYHEDRAKKEAMESGEFIPVRPKPRKPLSLLTKLLAGFVSVVFVLWLAKRWHVVYWVWG